MDMLYFALIALDLFLHAFVSLIMHIVSVLRMLCMLLNAICA